ncbi:MAG: hypothetical protein ACKO3K_17065 [Cuspidothrix sp.]
MQLINLNFIQESVEFYNNEFFYAPEYADNFTLEDIIWTLEQLTQHLELSGHL